MQKKTIDFNYLHYKKYTKTKKKITKKIAKKTIKVKWNRGNTNLLNYEDDEENLLEIGGESFEEWRGKKSKA